MPDGQRAARATEMTAAAPDLAQGAGISVPGLIGVLLDHWRPVLLCPAALVAAGLAWSLLVPPLYQAASAFLPQTGGQNVSQLAGLAAQFGVNLGASTGQPENADFYAALLRSNDLLKDALLSPYRFAATPGGTDSIGGTLLDLYGIRGGTETDRVRRGIRRLNRRLSVNVDVRAGLVRLVAFAKWQGLAVQLNHRLLDLVNRYNLERRQSQAGVERRFVETRMQDAQQGAKDAEDALATFLEHNRRYQDSPQLTFEEGRLQRQVDLRQQLYTSLAQAYEKARIDEVRNTPVVTVVDNPEDGVERDSRHLVRNAALGLFLGGALGVVLAFAQEFLAKDRRRWPHEYAELAARLRAVRGALGRR